MCVGALLGGGAPEMPAVQPIEKVEQPTPVDAGSTARKTDLKKKALAAAGASATGATGPGGLLDPATVGAASLLGNAARMV